MPEKTCEIIICLGAGGVGKTSVSAMLGLDACKRGKKALVITIDPARRLLDAFGIKEPTSRPVRVALDRFSLEGYEKTQGELWAFMPNLSAEWMDFLHTAISESSVQETIENNPFYRGMAQGVPGSLEIICTHIVFRLLREQNYDILILDTPPAANSISFIDVPDKLIRVLEHRVFKYLVNKESSFLVGTAKKLAFFSSSLLKHTFERVMGSHFLSQILEFSLTINELYSPLLERAHAMRALLRAPKTRFVLVTRPEQASLQDAKNLAGHLGEKGLKIHEIIVNQMLFKVSDTIHQEKSQVLLLPEGQKIVDLVEDFLSQVRYEERLVASMKDIFLGCDFSFLFLVKNSHHDVLAAMLENYWKQNYESFRD